MKNQLKGLDQQLRKWINKQIKEFRKQVTVKNVLEQRKEN